MQRTIKFALAVLITVASAVSIIYIFGIYRAPDYTHKTEVVSRVSTATISLASDTLTYDGTGTFNIMDGVTATTENDDNLTDKVFTSIKTDSTIDKKIILYSVADSSGAVATAERKLILDNYKGPSIHFSSEMPPLTQDTIEHITSYEDYISVDDGYGNDIFDSITISAIPSRDKIGDYEITASVTNMFNDTVASTVIAEVMLTGPVIVLKDDVILLDKGSHFNPANHIEYAVDKDKNDVTDKVTVSGTINENTTGTYTIQYSYTDENNHTAQAMLKIEVE